jgi:class 3 adenylate cyclase
MPRVSSLMLTPAARPSRPFPLAIAAAAVVSLLLGAILRSSAPTASAVLTVATVVLSCGLGAWLEDRLYSWGLKRPPAQRLIIGAFVPAMAWVPTVVLLVGLDALKRAPFVGPTIEVVQVSIVAAALWMTLAAVGSLLVMVLDVVISALVPDFRSRITLAVFALLVVAGGLAAIAATVVPWLAQQAVRAGNLNVSTGDENLTQAQLAELIPELGPFLTMLLTVSALLLALPALLSACGKLADAVMERLNPLGRGFELLSTGQLAVQVEEKGSVEFQRLNRAFNQMVRSLDQARGLERTFGAYLGEPIVQRIRAQHGGAVMPATSREATVMFADIRGFTSMSEKLAPQAVLDLLNRYLERAVAVVERHEGYINKFIGDAIVVIFNGPIDQPDHAERGARCALALQAEIAALNAAGAFPEVGTLRVGIGVATGPLVAGNLGSTRTEYTVIGDTVNLAARLTSHAGPGEAWVNETNARALGASVKSEALPPLKVKGKEHEVVPHRLMA